MIQFYYSASGGWKDTNLTDQEKLDGIFVNNESKQIRLYGQIFDFMRISDEVADNSSVALSQKWGYNKLSEVDSSIADISTRLNDLSGSHILLDASMNEVYDELNTATSGFFAIQRYAINTSTRLSSTNASVNINTYKINDLSTHLALTDSSLASLDSSLSQYAFVTDASLDELVIADASNKIELTNKINTLRSDVSTKIAKEHDWNASTYATKKELDETALAWAEAFNDLHDDFYGYSGAVDSSFDGLQEQIESINDILSLTDNITADSGEAVSVTAIESSTHIKYSIGLNIAQGEKVLSQSENGIGTTLTLTHDAETKQLVLAGLSGEVISTVDTSLFINDGMISSVEYVKETGILTITWNTDAGKEATTIDLSELMDVENVTIGEDSSSYLSTGNDSSIITLNALVKTIESGETGLADSSNVKSYVDGSILSVNGHLELTDSSVNTLESEMDSVEIYAAEVSTRLNVLKTDVSAFSDDFDAYVLSNDSSISRIDGSISRLDGSLYRVDIYAQNTSSRLAEYMTNTDNEIAIRQSYDTSIQSYILNTSTRFYTYRLQANSSIDRLDTSVSTLEAYTLNTSTRLYEYMLSANSSISDLKVADASNKSELTLMINTLRSDVSTKISKEHDWNASTYATKDELDEACLTYAAGLNDVNSRLVIVENYIASLQNTEQTDDTSTETV